MVHLVSLAIEDQEEIMVFLEWMGYLDCLVLKEMMASMVFKVNLDSKVGQESLLKMVCWVLLECMDPQEIMETMVTEVTRANQVSQELVGMRGLMD